tara:strand:+ start:1 stop:1158 length:1158 start_codon:yes stop_codon:yes gene_type:complete
MEQINKMVDVKNMKPYGDYGKLLNDYSTSKTKGNKNNLLLAIRNGIVPDQENPLRAFLNDKGFGNGQTFSDLLKTDVNRASIEKVLLKIGDFDNEEDSKGVISKSEYDNFINAIVNPDNEFWKNNGGASAWKDQSRTIATELLANGAENAWDTNPDNKPDPVITIVPDTEAKLDFYSKGNKVQLLNNQYLSGGSAQALFNDIQSGNSFDAKDPLTGEINNYSYKFVGEEGGWYQNYEQGDTPATKESYIGSTGSDMASVFTNDARYNDIQTGVEQEVDLKTGLTNFDNPFGDGTNKIATLPSGFTKAVGKDDLKVKEYLDNMEVTGLEVKASGLGSDSVTLKLGGKSKTFIVDTNFTDDEDRASEIWKWLHTNWSGNNNQEKIDW